MISLKSLVSEEKEAFRLEKEGKLYIDIDAQSFGYSFHIYSLEDNDKKYYKGYMNLAKSMPDEMQGAPKWKYGYLLVDHIKVDPKKQGYGFLLYKAGLKLALKKGYRGLCSYKKGRSNDASDIWNKLAMFSDNEYDYLDVSDLKQLHAPSLTEKIIPIFRGESVHNKGGNFWTTDKNFAREFTQSGLDREILKREIDTDQIYKANPLPQATSENEQDTAEAYAKANGYKAYWMDEGPYAPSIYVIDKSVLI
jgi:hypothetical protein